MRAILLLLLLCSCGGLVAGEAPADEAAFLKACGELAAKAEGRVVAGKDGWHFLKGELTHLAAGPFWGEAAKAAGKAKKEDWRDPLAAIIEIKQQLDTLGIELVLMPVPPRALVYADKLGIEVPLDPATKLPRRCDPHHRAFYALLKEQGVTVIDLTERFLAGRATEETQGTVCLRTDSHWSPRGIGIAAEAVHELLGARDWAKAARKDGVTWRTVNEDLVITGDLKDGMADPKLAEEKLVLPRVGIVKGEGEPAAIEPDPASPLMLLADSHGLVFGAGVDMNMHATRGALPDRLAAAFGFAPDARGRMGSASIIFLDVARDFYQKAGYRDGKKAIVWCFRTLDFTESTNGWRNAPLTLKPKKD